MNAVKSIAVIGGESTGKTTAAVELTQTFRLHLVPEFVRHWTETHGRPTAGDFDHIARSQWKLIQAAMAQSRSYICDTCSLMSLAYGRRLYQLSPVWLEETVRQMKFDLILLMEPDIPWRADDCREMFDPEDRLKFHHELVEMLAEFNRPFQTISGDFRERLEQAQKIVGNLFNA